jgi:hypothetical protein
VVRQTANQSAHTPAPRRVEPAGKDRRGKEKLLALTEAKSHQQHADDEQRERLELTRFGGQVRSGGCLA